jgi:hypothetical protein
MMVNFTLFDFRDKYIHQLKERPVHIFQYIYRKKLTKKLILIKRHLLSKNYVKKIIMKNYMIIICKKFLKFSS